MAAPIDLYTLPPSPPCRNVLLVARALGLKLNLHNVNVMAGEQLSPEFVKINPQHSIPTIVDGGLVLWESRAIMMYLVDMYGKDDSLYPRDIRERALVNQRLYFDACTLYQRILDYFSPVVRGLESPDESKKNRLDEALGFLDTYLAKSAWAAGSRMTIADISIIVSVSTAEAVGMDITKYTNVWNWYEKAKMAMNAFDYQELNQEGANTLGGIFRSKLK